MVYYLQNQRKANILEFSFIKSGGGRFPRARPQPPQRSKAFAGSSVRALPAGVAATTIIKAKNLFSYRNS